MNVIEMMNTIRDNASQDYQDRIPEATRNNLEDIRFAMIDDENIMVANEFMLTLLNKLVKSYVHTKMFSNPLKSLKRGKKPLGDTVEEIYQNFIKGDVYDANGVDLLNRKLPDTKTVYHRMNYKHKYKQNAHKSKNKIMQIGKYIFLPANHGVFLRRPLDFMIGFLFYFRI